MRLKLIDQNEKQNEPNCFHLIKQFVCRYSECVEMMWITTGSDRTLSFPGLAIVGWSGDILQVYWGNSFDTQLATRAQTILGGASFPFTWRNKMDADQGQIDTEFRFVIKCPKYGGKARHMTVAKILIAEFQFLKTRPDLGLCTLTSSVGLSSP